MSAKSPYEFVRVAGVGWVDVNKFRVCCTECGHEMTHRADYCEHMQPGDQP